MQRALDPRVVMVVELRRPEQDSEWSEPHSHVGVDEDPPRAAEHGERCEDVEAKPEDERRQVLTELGAEAIERMLAVRGKPVEVLARVMHGVEAPQEVVMVARPMEPIDKQITEDYRL